jgi:hypothetical protein
MLEFDESTKTRELLIVVFVVVVLDLYEINLINHLNATCYCAQP